MSLNHKNPWMDENEYKIRKNKYYCIGYFIKNVSAPYMSYSIGYHTPNDPPFVKSIEISENYEYVKEFKNSITKTDEFKLSFEAQDFGIKLNANIDDNMKHQIEERFQYSRNISLSEKDTISYAYPSSGYYKVQRRALYKMYIVQIYEAIYQQNTRIERRWLDTYTYYTYGENPIKYKLIDYYLEFNCIDDLGINVVKYAYDEEGNCHYQGPEENSSWLYL